MLQRFHPMLLQVIKKRKSEILIDYCYTTCVTRAPVRNVTDRFGNLLEQIEGDKLHAAYEPRPTLPPLVHREVHYLVPGAAINFTCPQ